MSQKSGEEDVAVLLTDLLEKCPLCLLVKPNQLLHHHYLSRLPVCNLHETQRHEDRGSALSLACRRPHPHPECQGDEELASSSSHTFHVMLPALDGVGLNTLIDEETEAQESF